MITVVIPILSARAARAQMTIDAYLARSRDVPGGIWLRVETDAPTCGEAWALGAEDFRGDYLHFGADDLEPQPGWWRPLVEACDRGALPCPVVEHPDGSVESAGGDGWELATDVADDWAPVQWTTVPFMSRAQWEHVRPMPRELHYCTDVWCSARLGRVGVPTVLRPASRFRHFNEPAGKGAGMDVHARNRHDRALFDQLIEETP